MRTVDWYETPKDEFHAFLKDHEDCVWGPDGCEVYEYRDPVDVLDTEIACQAMQDDGVYVIEGARPIPFTDHDRQWLAERIFEDACMFFDENLGSHEQPIAEHEPSRKIIEDAAETFVRTFFGKLKPGRCEPVARITVDVARWLREEEGEPGPVGGFDVDSSRQRGRPRRP